VLPHKFLIKLYSLIYEFPGANENSQFNNLVISAIENSFICKSSYFGEDLSASLISISLANIGTLHIVWIFYYFANFVLSFWKIQNSNWNGQIKSAYAQFKGTKAQRLRSCAYFADNNNADFVIFPNGKNQLAKRGIGHDELHQPRPFTWSCAFPNIEICLLLLNSSFDHLLFILSRLQKTSTAHQNTKQKHNQPDCRKRTKSAETNHSVGLCVHCHLGQLPRKQAVCQLEKNN